MIDQTKKLLFATIRAAIKGKHIDREIKEFATENLLKDVIAVATKHDLTHLVAFGILKNELANGETKQELQQPIFRAIYRYERLNYDLNQLCEAFENAEIPFLPLKGSVIRKYYPETWMRTSCDIDILVKECDLRRAVSYLVEKLQYIEHGQYTHDVSLFSPGGVHLELHFNLVEDNIAGSSSEILSNIWNVVTLKDGCAYHYEMPDEAFYFYHIAHMAKHFENGGCGIRPFIDLLILDNIQDVDREKRDALLEQGDLLKFANVARKLSRIWLSNELHDFVTKQMEDYILRGGVYGNNENRITVQQQKKGGSVKYALSKIVIPYDELKFHYPILQKHRWLTPVMQVRRWFKLIFCGHAKRSMRELSYNSNISKSQADEMKTFLDEIGL
jgi:hypothetical protein